MDFDPDHYLMLTEDARYRDLGPEAAGRIKEHAQLYQRAIGMVALLHEADNFENPTLRTELRQFADAVGDDAEAIVNEVENQ